MDETRITNTTHNIPDVWPQRLKDWQVVVILTILALGMRTYALWMTEVPARDSIGFIRYALHFEKENWQEVIKKEHQHPGYPLSILAVSKPIRWFTDNDDCYTMQYSAQIASAIAGWLVVIPLYLLGRFMFYRSAAFWGALFFQCIPGSGQTLSDAISDPLFLLLAAIAILCAVVATERNSWVLYALSGFVSGLTYLVRPEGIFIMAAAGIVLICVQFVPKWRRPWRKTFTFGTALILGGVVSCTPYIFVTGKLSNKPTVDRLLDQVTKKVVANQDAQAVEEPPAGTTLFASAWAVHINTKGSLRRRMLRGLQAICAEFADAYQYIGWLPALIGIWWFRDLYKNRAGMWVGVSYFLLQGGAVWWLTVNVGYVSDRHVLPLIVTSLYQASGVLLELPFQLRKWSPIQNIYNNPSAFRQLIPNPAVWSLSLVLLVIGVSMIQTLRPMHEHRAGHRAAGVWLAQNAAPADAIDDDHCWAHFYAGRVMAEGKELVRPAHHKPVLYVVYSRPKEKKPLPMHRQYHEADLKARGGVIVYRWPESSSPSEAQVVVYKIAPKR